jgi:hypothetical protein
MPVPNNAQQIYSALVGVGFSPAGAAGVLGNIEQETGGNPEHNEASCTGMVCWVPPNYGVAAGGRTALGPLVTGDVGQDIGTQAAYIVATGGISAALGFTPEDAASSFMSVYERCDPRYCNEPNRRRSARDVYDAAKSGQWQGGGVSLQPAPATALPAKDFTDDKGTGLTLWDVLVNGGGLGELMIRLAETTAGGILFGAGLVIIALTLLGKGERAAGPHAARLATWGKRVAGLIAIA